MAGVRWINSNLNPLTPVVELITGKSVESDLKQDKSRVQAATEGALFLLPEIKAEVIAEKSLVIYEVGTVDNLIKNSVKGDGLDIHHVSQSKPASQVVAGYEKSKAPAIALSQAEHKAIMMYPKNRAGI